MIVLIHSSQLFDNSKGYWQDLPISIIIWFVFPIVYNSSWLEKLSSVDFIKLSAKYTVARMLERNDFHLLIIALLFLRKLSIVGENKN